MCDLAAEQLRGLLIALIKSHAAWGTEMMMCNKAWQDGFDELPMMTDHLYDGWLDMQRLRNRIAKQIGFTGPYEPMDRCPCPQCSPSTGVADA